MKMYVVRHAEREVEGFFNPQLRHQDGPITRKGQRDAERLRAFFNGKPIEAIYVSAYQRTWQTIEPAARQLGLDPVIDARLNEIDNGLLDGMSDEDIQVRFPDVWQAFTARSADFRFPEGETGEEVRQRIASFLEEKRRQHQESIIAVAHDGLIRTLACHILGLPVYDRWYFQIDFCGIVEISIRDDTERWKLIRFNQSCP